MVRLCSTPYCAERVLEGSEPCISRSGNRGGCGQSCTSSSSSGRAWLPLTNSRVGVGVVGVLVADEHELGLVLLQQVAVLVILGRAAERHVHRLVRQHHDLLAPRLPRRPGAPISYCSSISACQLFSSTRKCRRPQLKEYHFGSNITAVVVDSRCVPRRSGDEVLVVADGRPDRDLRGGGARPVVLELRVGGAVGEVAADLDEGEVRSLEAISPSGPSRPRRSVAGWRVGVRVGDVGEREVVARLAGRGSARSRRSAPRPRRARRGRGRSAAWSTRPCRRSSRPAG